MAKKPKHHGEPEYRWGICFNCALARSWSPGELSCGARIQPTSQKRDQHGRMVECSLWRDGYAAADLAFDAAREGRR